MQSTLKKALSLLSSDNLVAIPTETVYGLAAAIDSPRGIEKIFTTKERPFFDPLIVHVSSIQMAKQYTTQWNETAEALAKQFWPGPLTLVLPKRNNIDDKITAGLSSVGLRAPNNQLTLDLITKLGIGIAAPSANKFKKTSPTCAHHVREEFPDVYVLDDGPCDVGIESTVCGIKEIDNNTVVEIYRPGMILKKDIEKALAKENIKAQVSYQESEVSPGAMKYHYMPAIPLIVLENNENFDQELIKAKKELGIQDDILEITLSANPSLAARELYQTMRKGAKTKAQALLIKLNRSHFNEKWTPILNRIMKAKSYPR